MLKKWKWVLGLELLLLCGCGKAPDETAPADLKPTEYDFIFKVPDFMEVSPEKVAGLQVRWIWYTKDGTTLMSHLKMDESREILESGKYIKYMVEEKVGLTLESEIVQESPTRYTYVHKDADGWEYLVAEETPDQRSAIAIYAIYPSITDELPWEAKAESILEALKAGRFEEVTEANRITAVPPRLR